jgi:hypothetical protein
MSTKPIFVATHPRACSTAFERVFMTRRDTLQCVHEPFGDAWYYGPERLCDRYENDEKTRIESGHSNTSYRDIFEMIKKENTKDKRLFIKDMAQYWIPTDARPSAIAPSLVSYRRGVGTESDTNGHINGRTDQLDLDVHPAANAEAVKKNGYPYSTYTEPNNPTIIPEALLKQFHFTFLIRHPRSSIPSYYRCTIPPLSKMTGFDHFMPKEAGYAELRALFDYLRGVDQVGPHICNQQNGANGYTNGTTNGPNEVDICLIDADDLLDAPYEMIEKYCNSVGIDYSPRMLKWDEEDQGVAKELFEKWKGFHEDAIDSNELKPRTHKKVPKSDEELFKEWTEKYGEEGAKLIQETVKENVKHYEYLKQFAIKI